MCEANEVCTLHSTKKVHSFDLNCLPEERDAEQTSKSVPDKRRRKRAAPSDIAKIYMDDLVKYFDVTINEAAKSLNVGLTALKRKCRELGIPRWPHRKIKSLGTLIHNLQEEAKRQEQVSKAAALAVVKKQKMLESEKGYIEKKPFVQLQTETKRFRQDIFKRRHMIKARNNTVKKTKKRRKKKNNNRINISNQNNTTTTTTTDDNNTNNSNNTNDNSSNNSNSTNRANDNSSNNNNNNSITTSTTTATSTTTTGNISRSNSSSMDSSKTAYYQLIPLATLEGI